MFLLQRPLNQWHNLADNELLKKLSQWRQYLHIHPELSNQEWQTAKWLKTQLQEIGIPIIEYENMPGFVARIQGTSEEELALRADMDALPIEDEKDCTYQSQAKGVMHACGHDGHMTMLLGLAKILHSLAQEGRLKTSIRLIFQHSEEQVPGGAKPMIEAGVLGKAKYILGAHLWSTLEVGKVGIRPGVMMAAADRFIVEIQGKGGHGSMPHQTVDSVVVVSELVQNLQTIISRNVNPLDSAVITVGTIHAGTNFNIIADKARMTGTVRTFRSEIQGLIRNRMEQVVSGTCNIHQAEYQLQYIEGYPPVINDSDLTTVVITELENIINQQNIVDMDPVMGGEDFSYYLQQIPGVYFFIGAGNQEKGIVYPQHHPKYDIDEQSMLIGVRCFLSVIEKMQENL